MSGTNSGSAQSEDRRDARDVIAPNLRGLAVRIDELSCDSGNVRRHSERNVEAIRASLKQFGQQKPIVVDARGVVIAGNGTLEAARELGWEYIAAVESELEGTERTAFSIADNRTAELAEWDEPALLKQLTTLRDDDSIDHLVVGFSDAEIQKLVDGVGDLHADLVKGEPEIPECFQVVVECESEDHQRELYEQLTSQGLKCRLLVL